MAFADGTADFRSDTVTRPTPEMRRAMAEAEVGDDVYRDDPTVNRLEENVAELMGKEAGLFVTSGSMGNQLAIMTQTSRGDEVLCDEGAHVRNFELGAAAALSGVAPRTVAAPGGRITPEQIAEVMSFAGKYFPRISLMVWENSHNFSGGQVIPLEVLRAGVAEARKHRLAVHLDGARIFNAAAYLDVEAKRIASDVDTVQLCFSKGLGAPIGSILCGSSPLIADARYRRKMLGGGMRQVGVLAAAAEVALAQRERLVEDHQLASYMGETINRRAPGAVDLGTVHTNIVMVDPGSLPAPIGEIVDRVKGAGIKVNSPIGPMWRLVAHRDVDRADVDRLVAAIFGS